MTYFPYIGGAEVAVKELTDRMPNIGFDMITLRIDCALPSFEKIGNITVHRIGFSGPVSDHAYIPFPLSINKYLFPFLSFFKALSLHRKNHHNAVWSIMANYAGFGALFFKYVNPRVPFFLNIQEGDPVEHIQRRVGILLPLFKQIFKRADYIHAISEFLAAFARDMGGHTVEVIPNGVDVAAFLKGHPTFEIKMLKKKYRIPDNVSLIVSVSRLVIKNGLSDLILSLASLPSSVHVLLVGDGKEKENLINLALEKNLSDRVHFTGRLSTEEVPAILSLADVFVRPSLSEGLGNAFLEAMAAGVPVVATAVGGIPDFLFDPKTSKNPTGLFCAPSNPQSIASAVKRLSDFSLKSALVSNARTLVCERYEWGNIARTLLLSFKKCIA